MPSKTRKNYLVYGICLIALVGSISRAYSLEIVDACGINHQIKDNLDSFHPNIIELASYFSNGERDPEKLFNALTEGKVTEPDWPIKTFLLAEWFLKSNDTESAHRIYSDILKWADLSSDGQTGIVVLAIWRDLQIRNQAGIDNSDIDEFLKKIRRLLDNSTSARMFSFFFHTSLPLLKEEIYFLGAKLAWSTKREKEINLAKGFYLDYLLNASSSRDEPFTREIEAELHKDVSIDKLKVNIGRQKVKLGDFEGAVNILEKIYSNSSNIQVRVEAAYELALILKNTTENSTEGKERSEALEKRNSLLDFVTTYSSDPDLTQQGFLLWARNQTDEIYEQKHKQLIALFPEGDYVDTALAKLGRHYWHTARKIDVELTKAQINDSTRDRLINKRDSLVAKSLEEFKILRNHKLENNWIETAHFVPALILFSEATKSDVIDRNKLIAAKNLLKQYLKTKTTETLLLSNLFWLGRIENLLSENSGNQHFERIINLAPFSYYGIRSKLRLVGDDSAENSILLSDSSSKFIQNVYSRSSEGSFKEDPDSNFSLRLKNSIATGLYPLLVSLEEGIRKKGRVVEKYPLDELEEKNLLVPIAMLLSYRQDAFVAAMRSKTYDGRLKIASELKCLDPFIAIRVVNERVPVIQKEVNFFANAYPKVYHRLFLDAASQFENILPSVLYGLAMHESYFFPSAISQNEATGFFQFLPTTFNALDDEWALLKDSKFSARNEYLFDLASNINLGARWIHKNMQSFDDNLLLALMSHNAGSRKTKEWQSMLLAEGKLHDLEYAIESIEYAQTRNFLRETIANIVISKASGMFLPESGVSQ